MNGTICPFGSARCTPLITPAETLDSKPNGEPIAITHSPRLIAGIGVEVERRQVRRVDLDQRDVGALVAADDLGRELAAIGELDRHFAGAVDDVRVGDDVAVRAHDEARPQAAHLRLRLHAAAGATRAVGNAEALEELRRYAAPRRRLRRRRQASPACPSCRSTTTLMLTTDGPARSTSAVKSGRFAAAVAGHGGRDNAGRRGGRLRAGQRARVEVRVARRDAGADAGGDQCVGDFASELHRALLGGKRPQQMPARKMQCRDAALTDP